jgi:Ni,Fe-hydrogenase I large subunit
LSEINNDRDNFEENYTDFRSLLASRSIARNSFASIVAEKAESVGKSTPFAKNAVKAIMKTPADVDKLLGANPSYFAQMEVLTKKLYQSPDFIKNLMTNDTNVTRSRVAMKAVDLQQNQDLLNSLYRREMLLATYLEQMINDSRARTNIDKRSMEN